MLLYMDVLAHPECSGPVDCVQVPLPAKVSPCAHYALQCPSGHICKCAQRTDVTEELVSQNTECASPGKQKVLHTWPVSLCLGRCVFKIEPAFLFSCVNSYSNKTW